MKTREEHLRWAKDRALKYLDEWDLENACVSMLSDLSKHDETKDYHPSLLALGVLYVNNNDHAGMQRWIEGFR